MRAVEVTAHGDAAVLSTTNRPRPVPGDDEILVDVAAAGVNFADIEKRRGRYPGSPEPPYVPGIEVAGRVAEAGANTDRTPGERVMALPLRGGYAESVAVDAAYVFDAPEGVDLSAAAAVPVQWITAHNALFEWGDLSSGERVLVHAAAGGVGSAAVQLAAAAGAEVFATASTAEKRAFAREMGADYTIDYSGDVSTAVADAVERATGTREGLDLVLDGVGGDAFDAGLDALGTGGRVVAYGLASGDVPSVSTPQLLFGNHAVLGYHLRRAVDHQRPQVVAAVERLRSLLSDGEVAVQVDRTVDFENAAAAHEHVENRGTRGKVLLEP